MIELFDWSIYESIWGIKRLTGLVKNHPCLRDGMTIHSSDIKRIIADDVNHRLLAYTHTGHEYELLYSEIDLSWYSEIVDITTGFGVTIPEEKVFKKFVKEAEKQADSEASKILSNNELYIQMIGESVRYAFFRNSDGKVTKLCTDTEVFMDRARSLLLDSNTHKSLLMYTCYDGVVDSIACSDDVKVIKIYNFGNESIRFMGGTEYGAGKITTIKREDLPKRKDVN